GSSPRRSASSRTTWSTSARSADLSRRAVARSIRQTQDGWTHTGGTTNMGMGNLQRMPQQMQQELVRIQGELETMMVDGSAGGGVGKARHSEQHAVVC